MKAWWKAGIVAAGVWALAAGAIYFSRASRPTPESVATLIRSKPMEGLDPAGRMAVVERVADQVVRLNFEGRQQLRTTLADRSFFELLTPEERTRFIELTLPEGFRQLMEALNKMQPAARQKLVNRALEDIERDSPEIAGRIDDEQARKILGEGLSAFYEDASADVKLDFAPVIEKLQQSTQSLR